MAGASIKKNDEVQVISGKDRGKRGRVVNVRPKDGRVHGRGRGPGDQGGPDVLAQGRHPAPAGRSHADRSCSSTCRTSMLVCRNCGKAVRVGHREEAGVKVRFCHRCGAET